MSKTPPFNEALQAKIAAHVHARPLPTIGGTASSMLSMQIAGKQNPLVVRRTRPAPSVRARRVEPQPTTPEQDRDLHARAIKRFMRPTPGREHQDRLEGLMLHVLGNISPHGTKAQNMMNLILLSELCAAVERRPSLFRTPKTEDGQVKVQISDRLWLGYMFVVVAADIALREGGHKHIKAATLHAIRDIERHLPHGTQMDDLLPDGEAKDDQRKPGAPEISRRERRFGNLARRINNRRKALVAGSAPLVAQAAYSTFNSGRLSYAAIVDAAAGALLASHDPESMRAKAMLPTAE